MAVCFALNIDTVLLELARMFSMVDGPVFHLAGLS